MVPDLVVWFLVYIVKCHFQQYFSYIVAVTLIGGNQSTQGFKLPTSTAIGTDYIGSKSNHHTIMTMTSDHVYILQIICLKETQVIEPKPNEGQTHMPSKNKLNKI